VHRPADFLIEQDVAGEPLDVVVRPKGQLTEVSRPGVGVQHRVQEVLSLGRARLGDFAALERQLYAVHLAALKDGREREPHAAAGGILDRAGKHLAVREIFLPRRIDPRPPGY